MRTRVMIVDDSALVRRILTEILYATAADATPRYRHGQGWRDGIEGNARRGRADDCTG
jgi:hypothetical protein